jgi:hypothetical protein
LYGRCYGRYHIPPYSILFDGIHLRVQGKKTENVHIHLHHTGTQTRQPSHNNVCIIKLGDVTYRTVSYRIPRFSSRYIIIIGLDWTGLDLMVDLTSTSAGSTPSLTRSSANGLGLFQYNTIQYILIGVSSSDIRPINHEITMRQQTMTEKSDGAIIICISISIVTDYSNDGAKRRCDNSSSGRSEATTNHDGAFQQ